MTLRDALLTLAGPAWELHADDRARQICFARPADSAVIEPASEPPATEAVQTFPLEPSVSGRQPCATHSQIGSAACGERVGQYGETSGSAVPLKKKKRQPPS